MYWKAYDLLKKKVYDLHFCWYFQSLEIKCSCLECSQGCLWVTEHYPITDLAFHKKKEIHQISFLYQHISVLLEELSIIFRLENGTINIMLSPTR